MSALLVGIDGPSGSGKSTVAKRVAHELGIGYLDTGAMYRALTWRALDLGIDLNDDAATRKLADSLALEMPIVKGSQRVLVAGVDITEAIREPRISESVAPIARNLDIRAWMAREQRKQMLAARDKGTGMVAEGRDITTVVCPEADVRVLLTADEEARLRRRTQEIHGEVTAETLAATRSQIADRDRSDATVAEFMEPAPGVTVVDSSNMTIEQVADRVLELAREHTPTL